MPPRARPFLGSFRLRQALEDMGDQQYDCSRDRSFSTDTGHDIAPEQTARLWYFEDLQHYLEEVYNGDVASRAFERRRADLATQFAALRAQRANDLADLGWDPAGRRPYDMDRRRADYHWLRAALRAYAALCGEQATVLRRLARQITQPLPPPRLRPPDPPREPYQGPHPDHLESRLLDIVQVRCTSVVVEDNRITAQWFTPIEDMRTLAHLRSEIDFILAPAKVTECTSTYVTLTWASDTTEPLAR